MTMALGLGLLEMEGKINEGLGKLMKCKLYP